MTITIINGTHQTEVIAEISVTPGLLITQAIGWEQKYQRPRWHVTHQGTTQKITRNGGVPKRHARLIAGALGGLPIDWTLQTKEQMYGEANKIQDATLKSWLVRGVRE